MVSLAIIASDIYKARAKRRESPAGGILTAFLLLRQGNCALSVIWCTALL